MLKSLTCVSEDSISCLEPAVMTHKTVEIDRFVLQCVRARGLRAMIHIRSIFQDFLGCPTIDLRVR